MRCNFVLALDEAFMWCPPTLKTAFSHHPLTDVLDMNGKVRPVIGFCVIGIPLETVVAFNVSIHFALRNSVSLLQL